MDKQLFVFEEICSGCRSCEMWCSFVVKEEFSPSGGLIRIAKDPTGKHDMPIVKCNGKCPYPNDEAGIPICVEMCPTGALIYTNKDDAYRRRLELHSKRKVQPVFKLMAPWKWPYGWNEWSKAEN